MSNLASVGYIVPEILIGGLAVLLFLLAAAAKRPARWRRLLFPILCSLGLTGALLILLAIGPGQKIGQAAGAGGGCNLFFGLLAADPLSVFFRSLVLTASLVGVLLSLGSPSIPAERRGEYHGLLMVLTLGMCLLSASNHLLMIYVSMETISLSSYLLTGFDDRRERSREAGLKYVLYGGVASGVMLFGMSLLYGLFGDLSLPGLHQALAGTTLLQLGVGRWAVLLSLIFVLAGFGYKIAAVPFHMWCPDAYEGAPTPFTALLSVGPKAAGFAVLMRFFYSLFLLPGSMDTVLESSRQIPWVLTLGVISALTMTLGNLVAIVQNNLKRLLAYSSIAHAGYVLMGVTAGGRDGFEAVTLYLAIYLVMNLGAFAVVSAVDRSVGSEDLRAFHGLGKRAPLLGLVMAVFLLSLTGLPPTAGFIGKLYLFAALIHRGGFWFVALAVVGILNSVISLYYYARVLKVMYLEKTSGETTLVPVLNPATAVATVLALLILVFGIFWQPLATVARWSAMLLH